MKNEASLGKAYLDGKIIYFDQWLDDAEQRQTFQILQQQIRWRQDKIRLMGREIPIPRLQAWYGDSGCHYQYSNLKLQPEPWTHSLALLRDKVNACLGLNFNAVLLNYYRNGQDSVSWHADDEPELGSNPTIAAVSLGGARRMAFKQVSQSAGSLGNNKLDMLLNGGSLLAMYPPLQRDWQHSIPKTVKAVGERISLTFRQISAPG